MPTQKVTILYISELIFNILQQFPHFTRLGNLQDISLISIHFHFFHVLYFNIEGMVIKYLPRIRFINIVKNIRSLYSSIFFARCIND
nr:MAG TPA: hypothetical protein [Caudoviricetes sp.]